MKSLVLVLLLSSLAACSYDSSGIDWSVEYDASVADAPIRPPVDARADAAADPDAPAPPPDAALPPDAAGACGASCVLAGGTCEGAVCVIECGGLNPCASGVTCPDGVSCVVTCNGTNTCAGGVSCNGPSCAVFCSGDGACREGVDCFGDNCTIECSGNNACDEGACCGGRGDCGGSCDNSMGGCCECGGC